MKTTVVTFLLLCTSMPTVLSAQPAKDLFDAQQAARQHERDLTQGLELAHEAANELRLLLQVEATLGDPEVTPVTALDRAIDQMDHHDRELQRRRANLPTDMHRTIASARDILFQARIAVPTDITQLRDRWHHEVVHPMAKRVFQDTRAINNLLAAYAQIENTLRQAEYGELAALAGTENLPAIP